MNISPGHLLRHLAVTFLFSLTVLMPLPLCAFESIEELIESAEPQGNSEELFSILQDLRRNPLLINTATAEQLLELPLLTPLETATIIDWRRQRGPIGSGAELAAIIGEDHARLLSPFFSFAIPKELFGKEGEQGVEGSIIGRVFWETPPRAGIENGKYAGENCHLYGRFQAVTDRYGVTVLQDSDIGEPDADDFVSMSLSAQEIGLLSQAVVGNYRLTFGQGLLFGQGRFFSKGADAIDGVLLFAPALRPYTSAGETGFLQGAAATLMTGSFEMTAFMADDKIDASISGGEVTGFSETGYHRTVSEIARKDNLGREVKGFNLRYRYRTGELNAGIGVTWSAYRYGQPLEWLDDGCRGGSLGSVEVSAVYRRLQLFGETAVSEEPGVHSWICGVQSDLSPGITGVVSVRRYAIDYYSPFAGAFAEKGDGGSNEEGYYVGLRGKVLPNLMLASSYDIFRFPELDRESYPFSSSGHDARLYATWKQCRSITWEAMYQHKEKEETLIQTDESGIFRYVMPVPKTTNRVQLTLKSRLSPHVELKTGSAYKSIQSDFVNKSEIERGWLLYQQLNCRLAPFTVRSRVSLFNTDSYDAALYAYEDDLPQVYTLNPYYGRGKAWFILLDCEPVGDLNLTAKYDITWYSDREVYSSGNDLRSTSSPASFHLGVMWKF